MWKTDDRTEMEIRLIIMYDDMIMRRWFPHLFKGQLNFYTIYQKENGNHNKNLTYYTANNSNATNNYRGY